MNEILRVEHLVRSFKGLKALDDVSFSLQPGERLGVLGRSGSGKTTLIRLIAGLEAPDEGEIELAGKPASHAGRVLIPPERREVALVFQGLALFPHLNALDQIAFAARDRGGTKQARALLERIGLGHRATAHLDQLSGGERQRVALARALAQEPRIILMDEPFASLDDEKRAEMRDLLRSLVDSRETTLILVTHSREDALDLARRVLVLESGKPVANDFLENVLARPRHVSVARAFGLGQIISGKMAGEGKAQTVFGTVSTIAGKKVGPVKLLVRPRQPTICQAPDGVKGEVISIDLRPPELREVRRVAVVRVESYSLRLMLDDSQLLSVGNRVQIQISDECEILDDDTDARLGGCKGCEPIVPNDY